MIAIGQRYSLGWKYPHRIEATVTALEGQHVVTDVQHRCPPTCQLLHMSNTLPIEGEIRYMYADFVKLFTPMADGAIALPGGVK